MAKKTLWMVFVLGALLALSVSAVFAADVTRPAQAKLSPETNVSKMKADSGVSKGIGSYRLDRDCPFGKGDSASAY